MTTVFNKIHRLKRLPDWTWDHFLFEIDKISSIGLDEKTLYKHYREPHGKPGSHVTKIINQLHDHYFANPFPEDLNRLMRLYNNLAKSKSSLSRDKDIQDLEFFIDKQISRENTKDNLRISRLNWLLGNIHFDRIPMYRDNGKRLELKDSQNLAVQHYQASVEAIERHNQSELQNKIGANHLYKARHNILACYLNSIPSAQRSEDSAVLQYLRESDYIDKSKQTLVEEPFQWSIARNGLRFSSLIKNAANVTYFFNALLKINPQFLDLNYKPFNVGAISSGVDFEWAIKQVLTPEYLSTLKQKKKINGGKAK